MKIAKFSVDHSLLVNLLSAFILVWGLMAFVRMPREAFPNVNFNMATIETIYPGAAPQEVEKLITIPIEDEIRDVDGIDEVNSVSIEGRSVIVVKLDLDIKNSFVPINDIQRAVDRVTDIPEEAEDPVVTEIKTHDEPIIIVSMSGLDLWDLRRQVRVLEDVLEDVPGVARVDKSDWKETEIWVEIDPEKLKDYHLSFDEIARALKKRNINLPGGKVYVDGVQHVVRTVGEFNSPEEILEVVIRANDQGNWLTVGDVGIARYALEEIDRIQKTNGHPAANIVIIKKEGVDTLRLVKNINKEIEAYKKQAPKELRMTIIEDLSLKYLRRRLSILMYNASVGVVFVLLVLLLFLGKRVAFLTALGIPLALCATGIIMPMIGISINLLALFGLIIALGMLVDDAIVVSENCFRYIEKGWSPRDAAIKGTSEVALPVTATIATTVVAFAPLLNMTGIIGKFVWVIPAVVIIAIIASLFESLVILPSHIADFVKQRKVTVHKTGLTPWKRKLIQSIQKFYLRFLKTALRWRWAVMAGLLVLMALTLLMAATKMKFVLFPTRGVEMFFIRAEAPTGTSLEQVEERMRGVEAALDRLPKDELQHYITTVGVHEESGAGDPTRRRGTHLGQIQVYLTADADRERSAQQIIEETRKNIGSIENLEITFEQMQAGPPVGKPVEVHIRGDSFDILEKIAGEYKDFLKGIKGVKDIRDNYETGKPEFRALVDEKAARRARLGIEDAARTLRYAYEGAVVTSIKRTDEEVDVRLRFPEQSRHDPETLDALVVENDQGDLVPLRRIARFVREPGVSAVQHLDYKRSIAVTAQIDENITTSGEVHQMFFEKFRDISDRYPGYAVRYGGEQKDTQESLRNLFLAFGIALLAIYGILAATFNSLLHPFIFILAIPFGLIGVVLAFFGHGMPLSFMSMLGVVGLSGVVVNDSIILVDFINKALVTSRPLRAIMEAGRLRLRPVLLTTITTVAGLAPVAYGIGGLDVFLQPAALAIVWGLSFATALTLIIIPCLYAVEHDVRRWLQRENRQARI
jgi:multidrug efflux pump subunit AcrB